MGESDAQVGSGPPFNNKTGSQVCTGTPFVDKTHSPVGPGTTVLGTFERQVGPGQAAPEQKDSLEPLEDPKPRPEIYG